MGSLSSAEEAELRGLVRGAVSSTATAQPEPMVREFMRVTRVDGDSLDLDRGSRSHPMPLEGVPRTEACADAEVGDTVVVDTYMRKSVAVATMGVKVKPVPVPDTPNRVLWSGALVMGEGEVASMSEPLEDQQHGILLHWQGYDGGAVKAFDHVYTYVPKYHASAYSAEGVSQLMTSSTGDTIGTKYVYVGNKTVRGNKANSRGATDVGNGLKVDSSHWALTRIVGV